MVVMVAVAVVLVLWEQKFTSVVVQFELCSSLHRDASPRRRSGASRRDAQIQTTECCCDRAELLDGAVTARGLWAHNCALCKCCRYKVMIRQSNGATAQ